MIGQFKGRQKTNVYGWVSDLAVARSGFNQIANLGYLAPPGQFFMGAKLFIVSHSGGPNKQFGTHEKLSWGCKVTYIGCRGK